MSDEEGDQRLTVWRLVHGLSVWINGTHTESTNGGYAGPPGIRSLPGVGIQARGPETGGGAGTGGTPDPRSAGQCGLLVPPCGCTAVGGTQRSRAGRGPGGRAPRHERAVLVSRPPGRFAGEVRAPCRSGGLLPGTPRATSGIGGLLALVCAVPGERMPSRVEDLRKAIEQCESRNRPPVIPQAVLDGLRARSSRGVEAKE